MQFLDSLRDGIADEPGFEPARGRVPKGRFIMAPNPAMQQVQDRLIVQLRDNFDYPTPDARFTHNAERLMGDHSGRFVYVVDLSNAYGSVDLDRLAGMLTNRSGPHGRRKWFADYAEARQLLRRLVEAPGGGLIQGAPASPYFFELYVYELLDRAFARYADEVDSRVKVMVADPEQRKLHSGSVSQHHDLHYSRFADDMVFSSDQATIGKVKRADIKRVVRAAGFEVSAKKARLYDLDRGPVQLNSVTIRRNKRSLRVCMPKKARSRLEGLIYLALNDRLETSLDEIHGLFSYFLMATPRRPFNASEQRVADAYCQLRAKLGLEDRDYSVQGVQRPWVRI